MLDAKNEANDETCNSEMLNTYIKHPSMEEMQVYNDCAEVRPNDASVLLQPSNVSPQSPSVEKETTEESLPSNYEQPSVITKVVVCVIAFIVMTICLGMLFIEF
ncbi:hypothetical protein AB6A40_003518 [Gnathostoma spinigerum]|uniref:Uncharacterized protein n=1 Tax=Gnathostoma spinigerum TaxID=75299 RepID=A0ABD6EFB9_9BILA